MCVCKINPFCMIMSKEHDIHYCKRHFLKAIIRSVKLNFLSMFYYTFLSIWHGIIFTSTKPVSPVMQKGKERKGNKKKGNSSKVWFVCQVHSWLTSASHTLGRRWIFQNFYYFSLFLPSLYHKLFHIYICKQTHFLWLGSQAWQRKHPVCPSLPASQTDTSSP